MTRSNSFVTWFGSHRNELVEDAKVDEITETRTRSAEERAQGCCLSKDEHRRGVRRIQRT